MKTRVLFFSFLSISVLQCAPVLNTLNQSAGGGFPAALAALAGAMGGGASGASSEDAVLAELSDAEAVEQAYDNLRFADFAGANGAVSAIRSDLNFPTEGSHGVSLAWSSEFSAVAADGRVTRPAYSDGPVTGSIRVSIRRGDVVRTKTFAVTVLALPATDEEAVTEASANLTLDRILNGNPSAAQISGDLLFPTTDPSGASIAWSSDRPGLIATDGRVTRPAYSSGHQTVSVSAVISSGSRTEMRSFAFTVLQLPQSDAEAVQQARNSLTWDSIRAANTLQGDVRTNLTLPTSAANGVSISWSSTRTDRVTTSGTVIRPSYTEGSASVSLTATFSKNGQQTARTFLLTVARMPMTDLEAVNEAMVNYTQSYFLGSNSALSNVHMDLNMLSSAANGVAIAWTTSNSSAVSTSGAVTRPAYYLSNTSVTLEATFSRGAVSGTKSWTVSVRRESATSQERVANSYAALEPEDFLADNTSLDDIRTDLNFFTVDPVHSTTIFWDTQDSGLISTSGHVERPVATQPDRTIWIRARISYGSYSETKEFTVTVRAYPVSDSLATYLAWQELEAEDLLGANSSLDAVTSALSLPTEGVEDSSIAWSSSDSSVIAASGAVSRPSWTEGDAEVTLTAEITRGGATRTKTFAATVLALPQSDAEAVAQSVAAFTGDSIRGSNPDIQNVGSDLVFPSGDLNGVSFSYSSGSPAVLADDGQITRPAYSSGDATVELTVTFTRGAVSDTKTLQVTILEEPPAPIDLLVRNIADLGELNSAKIIGRAIPEDGSGISVTSVEASLNGGPFQALGGGGEWVYQLPVGPARLGRYASVNPPQRHTFRVRAHADNGEFKDVTVRFIVGLNRDFNGDGYSDFVASGPQDRTGAQHFTGSIALFLGGKDGPELSQRLYGWEGDRRGTEVYMAGDVNGDGLGDVMELQGGGSPRPRIIRIHPGRPDGQFIGSIWTLYVNGLEYWETDPPIQPVGDVNGDGYDDVMYTDWTADNGTGNPTGEVYLYYGGPSGPGQYPNWSGRTPGAGSDGFGKSIRAAGDVNGDGYNDFLVLTYTPSGHNPERRADLFLGGPGGPDYTPDWSLTARRQDEGLNQFYRVSGGGDVNCDLYSDFGLRLYGVDAGYEYQMYHGGPGGPGASPDTVFPETTEIESVEFLGDLDGDGCGETITIGEDGYDGWQLRRGSPTGVNVDSFVQRNPSGQDFQSISGVGHVDGDGRPDVAWGSYGNVAFFSNDDGRLPDLDSNGEVRLGDETWRYVGFADNSYSHSFGEKVD